MAFGGSKIRCCKDCVPPERHIGCHAYCKLYIGEKKQYEANKQSSIKQRRTERDVRGALPLQDHTGRRKIN